jgi:hypothetical protein
MDMYYVYGQRFDRFGSTASIKLRVEVALIQQIVKLRAGSYEPIDEYQDRLEQLLLADKVITEDLFQLLNDLVIEFDYKPDVKLAKAGQPFYFMSEEGGYGFGFTKDAARLEYQKGEAKHSDGGDDGDNDW